MEVDLPVARHVTQATYSRLLIPDLSPEIQRAVYLDADILVVDDITELLTVDLGGANFGACVDKDTPTVATGVPYSWEKLGLPPERAYFNAGLLVIDVPAWRDAGVSPAITDYVREWDVELRCPDQEGLNVASGEHALALDQRFNFQVSGEGLAAQATGDRATPHRDLNRAAIVHFTGPKPWLNVWFSSSIWARPAGWWWTVALRSPLISTGMRARLLLGGGAVAGRELRRLVACDAS